ncbi:MAG: esterase family protein, partial [Actinomycetota bacterium]|nr:esterase family protein [Actinomycetota bacterium]
MPTLAAVPPALVAPIPAAPAVQSRPAGRVPARVPAPPRLPAPLSLLAAARSGLVQAVGEQLP